MVPASSRERLSFGALLTMTIVCGAICVLFVLPFGPGLVWAVAFAMVAFPVHERILRRLRKYPSAAAAISVTAVALVLVTPVAWVGWQIASEISAGIALVEEQLSSGGWRQQLDWIPQVRRAYEVIAPSVDIQSQVTAAGQAIQRFASGFLQAGIVTLVQVLFMLFAMFFFFRDRDQILRGLRALMPLSDDETDELFERVHTMTRATLYGNVVTALVQGTLGGVIFFLVGIPGAVGWGAVMAALSLVPTLGAFVIWIPAAILLAMQGDWGRALILAVWGSTVVGMIDNVLYPWLVGKEMRLHTLLVFLAVVGGLVVFGAAGLVLGPAFLAMTIALLDILRTRTRRGRQAAKPA
jgi:predicted PurR-regulated permease PerM